MWFEGSVLFSLRFVVVPPAVREGVLCTTPWSQRPQRARLALYRMNRGMMIGKQPVEL